MRYIASMRAIDTRYYQLSNNNIRALSPKKGIKYFEPEVPKWTHGILPATGIWG